MLAAPVFPTMPRPSVRQLRRALIIASALTLIPLASRGAGVAAELRRDRLAASVMAQASSLLGSGQYTLAAARFAEALMIAPGGVEAYGGLAEAEFRRGNIDAAVSAYRSLLRIYPYTYFAPLYREVGLIELRGGRLVDARRDLEQAVMLDPADWMAFHFLGHAHRRLGNREDARTAWRRVIALRPNYEPAHEQLRRLGQ